MLNPVDQIIACLTLLIKSKGSEMANAFMQKGGWEGWLQVELASDLNARFPLQIAAQREMTGPFKGDQRVDLLARTSSSPPVAIEIKAESIFQSGNNMTIGKLAVLDFDKIVGEGLSSEYRFLQFALALSGEGGQALKEFAKLAEKRSEVEAVFVHEYPLPSLDFLEVTLCVVGYKNPF